MSKSAESTPHEIQLVDDLMGAMTAMRDELAKQMKKEKDASDMTEKPIQKITYAQVFNADMATLKADMDTQIEALSQLQADILDTIRKGNALAVRARTRIPV